MNPKGRLEAPGNRPIPLKSGIKVRLDAAYGLVDALHEFYVNRVNIIVHQLTADKDLKHEESGTKHEEV